MLLVSVHTLHFVQALQRPIVYLALLLPMQSALSGISVHVRVCVCVCVCVCMVCVRALVISSHPVVLVTFHHYEMVPVRLQTHTYVRTHTCMCEIPGASVCC